MSKLLKSSKVLSQGKIALSKTDQVLNETCQENKDLLLRDSILGISNDDLPKPYKCKEGTWLPNIIHAVPHIPIVMENIGWVLSAKFQRRWLDGKSLVLLGRASDGDGFDGTNVVPMPIEQISMDWLLKYPAVGSLKDDLIRKRSFNKNADNLLKRRIVDLFASNPGAGSVWYGQAVDGIPREKEYTNYISLSKYDMGFNDFTGALGRFSLYSIPFAVATIDGDIVKVQIQKLGIYLRDSYDFNGYQYLGRWNLAKNLVGYEDGYLLKFQRKLGSICISQDIDMENWVYDRYRLLTGHGEDFLIYSDIHYVERKHYFQFSTAEFT